MVKTDNNEIFCEIFYRTELDLPLFEGMGKKTYPSQKYFHAANIYYTLEPNSRAMGRFAKQHLSLSNPCDVDCFKKDRPWFEEYRLRRPELDMYTPLDTYMHS